ncbi:COG1416 Uncharacterized conserved protein [Rhabdaerophilaceae bacterium]
MRIWTIILGITAAVSFVALAASGRIDEAYWLVRLAAFGPIPTQNLHVAPANTGPQKVVFHIVEKGNWRNRNGEATRLVAVLSNHIRAVEPDDLEVEVLMHGHGIDILRRAKAEPEIASRIRDLKRKGVKFVVCANTLQSSGVRLDELYGVTENDLVMSATARIIQLQQQGYGYIRF